MRLKEERKGKEKERKGYVVGGVKRKRKWEEEESNGREEGNEREKEMIKVLNAER